MLSSPEGAQLMHGLSLAEAFQRFVLNHPDVVPLANAAMKLDRSYEGVFREGQYPGHYVKFSWPLDISAEDLAIDFVRPFIFSLDRLTP